MGKIIKKLFDRKVNGKHFQIELNKAPSNKSDKNIHISFDNFRIELSRKEFYEISSTLLVSEKNLKILKKVK